MTELPTRRERSPYGGRVDGGTDEKKMRLRYSGTCRVCGGELRAGAEAIYERMTRTVRCLSHDVGAPCVVPVVDVVEALRLEVVESGSAGASARSARSGSAKACSGS